MASDEDYAYYLQLLLKMKEVGKRLSKDRLADGSTLSRRVSDECYQRMEDERLGSTAIGGLSLTVKETLRVEAEIEKLTRGIRKPMTSELSDNKVEPQKVFVVHGRNHAARDAVVALLRAMELQPIHWNQAKALTGNTSATTYDIVQAGINNAQAIVILLTGDEIVSLASCYQDTGDPASEKTPMPQARPNVIFEAGMAFALARSRTILLRFGSLRPWSDLDGVNYITVSDTAEFRHEFYSSLKTAKCKVSEHSQDFLSAGDLAAALASPSPAIDSVPDAGPTKFAEQKWVIDVLSLFVGMSDGLTEEQISAHFKVSRDKGMFWLHELEREGFVEPPWDLGLGRPSWHLTQDGRAQLAKHDLL